jgi:hypothetical protein
MTTSTDPGQQLALARAIEAAAEIAKNTPLFYSESPPPILNETRNTSNDAPPLNGTTSKRKMMNDKHFALKENEGDAEKRLARSRQRNREHARRTRLRKKKQLEALQVKVKSLEQEGRALKQSIEECSIASILVGLSSGTQDVASLLDLEEEEEHPPEQHHQSVRVTRVGKRKRFVVENGPVQQPLKLKCDGGKTTLIGGEKTHINWKSGVYSDENGVQHKLTPLQLESLRRERNRMHAKMTRDRKKSFISSVEQTIVQLERDNERMRNVLTKVAELTGSESVTPVDSPKLVPIDTPDIQDEDAADTTSLASKLHDHLHNSFNLSAS